jgi:hypothetical protein
MLVGAYQVNKQVQKVVSPLEQMIKIREQILAKDYPNQLALQLNLAIIS